MRNGREWACCVSVVLLIVGLVGCSKKSDVSLADVVPLKTDAELAWSKVKVFDRGQGFGAILDEAESIRAQADEFYVQKDFANSKSKYEALKNQCERLAAMEGQRTATMNARREALAAKQSSNASEPAAKSLLDAGDRSDKSASDAFEKGDFAAASRGYAEAHKSYTEAGSYAEAVRRMQSAAADYERELAKYDAAELARSGGADWLAVQDALAAAKGQRDPAVAATKYAEAREGLVKVAATSAKAREAQKKAELDAHIAQARALMDKKQFRAASAEAQRALELNSNDPAVLALVQEIAPQAAPEELQASVDEHLARARSLAEKQQYKEAVAEVQRALALKGDDANALALMNQLKPKLGDEDLRQAVEDHLNNARLMAQAQVYIQALGEAQKALALRKDDPAALALVKEISPKAAEEQANYRMASPDDRGKVIGRLMGQAREPANSDAVQCALLLEAGTLATAEPGTVCWVVDELDSRHPTSMLDGRFSLLVNAAHQAKTPEARLELADSCLGVADSAGWAGDYSIAVSASALASDLGKASKSATVAVRALAKADLFKELAVASRAATRPTSQSAASPQDAVMSAMVLCLGKNDWDGGLRLLAKNGDQQLQTLANADLASPAAADEMASLADRYGKLAAAARSSVTRHCYGARALYWYRRAIPTLSDAAKTQAARSASAIGAICVWLPRDLAVAQLKSAVLTAQWTWPGVVMTFRDDGTVSHRGMGGRYEITGPRRLILRIDNGDRMTFVFNNVLTHYTSVGRGFGGDRVQP